MGQQAHLWVPQLGSGIVDVPPAPLDVVTALASVDVLPPIEVPSPAWLVVLPVVETVDAPPLDTEEVLPPTVVPTEALVVASVPTVVEAVDVVDAGKVVEAVDSLEVVDTVEVAPPADVLAPPT